VKAAAVAENQYSIIISLFFLFAIIQDVSAVCVELSEKHPRKFHYALNPSSVTPLHDD
jgi:hypothetical protein